MEELETLRAALRVEMHQRRGFVQDLEGRVQALTGLHPRGPIVSLNFAGSKRYYSLFMK